PHHDLSHVRVWLELVQSPSARIEVWGHPTRKILIVEVSDPQHKLEPISAELTEWRDTMHVGEDDRVIFANEVHSRPARPHMATAGMQDYFTDETDPMLGRGTAVALGGSTDSVSTAAEGQAARLSLEANPDTYHIVIAAAVTPKGDPLAVARRELDNALTAPLAELTAEHQAWWRDYWSKSFLRLESPDNMAQWVTAAYYVHLYTLGCVNRGPVPAKWDGGAGLMRGDERTWGLAEWVQEIRFTYLPLYAANRLDVAKGLTDHYTRMVPYLREQTATMWGIPGLWIP
ncbi:MAG: hypothetical protein GY851_16990, partial [bacterium]|nr:hypothetical protein [bacterium]